MQDTTTYLIGELAGILGGTLLIGYLAKLIRNKLSGKVKGIKLIIFPILISASIVFVITHFTMTFAESLLWYFPATIFWLIYSTIKNRSANKEL